MGKCQVLHQLDIDYIHIVTLDVPNAVILLDCHLEFKGNRDARSMLGLEGFDVAEEKVRWKARLVFNSEATYSRVMGHIAERQQINYSARIKLLNLI
jgi:hypothetical protein